MHLRLHCKQMTTEDTVPTEETLDSVNEGGNAVQSTVNHTDSQWTPPEINEAISLFREYMRGKIVYTGRTLNANTFARILPLYQGFVEEKFVVFRREVWLPSRGKTGAKRVDVCAFQGRNPAASIGTVTGAQRPRLLVDIEWQDQAHEEGR